MTTFCEKYIYFSYLTLLLKYNYRKYLRSVRVRFEQGPCSYKDMTDIRKLPNPLC